jgi:carbon storage regulator
MLVLTRKQGEEIRIGDDIVLKVTSVQGGRVKIGIEAPRSHRIVRPEVERAPSEFSMSGALVGV